MHDVAAARKLAIQARSRYVAPIDGLRALAVLSVVAYHIDNRLLPGGFTGVDVFFVISGFVVSLSSSSLAPPRLLDLLANFYRRRMVRIVPPLLVVILLTQLLAVLFIPVVSKRTWEGDWSAMASTTSCRPYPTFATAIPAIASRYSRPSRSQTRMPSARSSTG